MKKFYTLIMLLLGMISVSFGQPHNYYQLPNNLFTSWTGGTMPLPVSWYSFSSADCQLEMAVCSTATALGYFNNHHTKVTGRNGNGFACQIYTVKKGDYNINGAMSNGRPVLSSTTLSDTGNYVYTCRSCTGNHWEFTGRPDSVSLWARFSFFQNQYPQAMVRVHIHGDVDYRDVVAYSASTPQDGKIANAYCVMTNPATTPTTINGTQIYKSDWTRFAFKLQYWDADNHTISTPTVNNTTVPSYILASFSTNRIGNVGLNDSLAFDDLFCIYDKSLASLKINGVENNTIKTFFNEKEYITHEKSNNSGSITYSYNNLICYNSADELPVVTATAKSTLINSITVTQATLSNPKAVITVTHNDNSTYVYTIHFTNLHQGVSANITSSTGSFTACEGETVVLTASGAPSYVWSNGATSTTIQPTTSGPYTVTGSNGHCTASKTVYMTFNELPNVTISGNSGFCAGGSTTLTAGGAATYVWNTTPASTSQSINVTASGTYTVTGTTSQNCSATASKTVTENPIPNLTISGPTFLCGDAEATLTANGADSYVWSGGGTGNTLTINTGGTYTVTGTNSYNCTNTKSISVESRQAPTVSISGADVVCEGSSILLTAAATPSSATLAWAGDTPENPLTVTAPGTYTVTATLNGCETSASKTVSGASSPAVPTVTPNSHCGPGSVTLTAESAPGTTCYWFASENTQSIAGSGDTFTTPTLSATTTYYVSTRNDAGCYSDRVAVTATIHQLPNAPTVSDTNVCGESDITLTATSGNTVHWYSDQAGEQEITDNQHVTQTTTFYAAAVDDNGCRSTLTPLTVTVNTLPTPPTLTQPEAQCTNGSVNVPLNATASNGNTVYWYNSEMVYQGQGNYFQARNLSSSTTYYAKAHDNATGCESEPVAVSIVINPIPAAPTLNSEPRCGAGEVTLDANGQTVTWYTADNQYLGEGVTYTTNITATTTFKATVTNQGCESAQASVTAVVNPVYTGITDNKTACGSYTWNGTTYTKSGEYTKTLTSSQNCDSIVTLHLTINDGFNQNFDTVVCEQFVWQGQTYTTTGSDTKTLRSAGGCDSVVTYYFTVNHNSTSTQTLTLCSNQLPYDFDGTSITSAGTYTLHKTNAAGCDSTITLQVTVHQQPDAPSINTTALSRCGEGNVPLSVSAGTNGTTCRWYYGEDDDEPFQTGNSLNQSYSETTTYYISSFNATTGCESGKTAITVTVNPMPAIPTVTNVARCGAGEITLTPETDENTTTCRWYANSTINTPVYTGLSYTSYVSAPQNIFYVESYNETTGCKSSRIADTAVVNAIPAAPTVSNPEHCGTFTADLAEYVTPDNTLYRWYDNDNTLLVENEHYTTTITETTSFLVSVYNAQTTCESEKTTMTVTILTAYEPQSIFDTTCQHTRYQNYNLDQTFDEPGTYDIVVNTQSTLHCDSVVTLHLLVKPQATHQFSVTACNGYNWDGTPYSASGDYTKTYTAANGCDSVVTLHLTISDSDQEELTVTACDEYVWDGTPYHESGDYTKTYTNHQNCDSIVTLHLTINHSTHTYPIVTACDEYVWDDTTYQTSGVYIKTYTGANHCDSVVTLTLTINHSATTALTTVLCIGERYNENGFDFTATEAGTFSLEQSLNTTAGCDSLVTLSITVHPTASTNLNESICFNESYNFNGKILTTSGTYVDTLSTVNDCDSIITLHLNVYPEKRRDIYADLCAGQSYNDYGFSIAQATESQNYERHNDDTNGCDSTTVLHLTVHQPASTLFEETLCMGEHYTQHGFDFTATEAGEFTEEQHLQTDFECDSTVTLHVTVRPANRRDIFVDACAGDSYNDYGFTINTVTQSEVLEHHDEDTNGCDSITVLHLTAHQAVTTTLTATRCQGVSYTDNGFDISTPAAGVFTYTQDLSTSFDCDSTVVLTLTVNPSQEILLADTICTGEAYTAYGFDLPAATQPGTFTHTRNLQNVFGCDSIVRLTLTVMPTSHIVLNDVACAGERYTQNGFDTTFRRAGTYTLFRQDQTVFGCDSTITLTIVVSPVYQQHLYDTICHNSSYVFNDQTITESGIYRDTLTSANSCDSILILHLNVRPERRDSLTADICLGEEYHGYGFDITNAIRTQYYTNTDSDIYGCDSTTVLHLFVHQPAVTNLFDTVCQNTEYNRYGFQVDADEAGTFTYQLDLETSFDCDSTVILQLTVNPVQQLTFNGEGCVGEPFTEYGFDTTFNNPGNYTLVHQQRNIYGCDSVTVLNLLIHSKKQSYINATICHNGEYDFHGRILTEPGVYTDTLVSSEHCDSIVNLHLDMFPERRDSLTAHTCLGTDYTGYGFHIEQPTETGYYAHTDDDVNGCDSTTVLLLYVHQPAVTNFDTVICMGESYRQNGFDIVGTKACDTTYTQHLQTEFECDSIVNLHLVVNPAHFIELNDEVCAGSTYSGHGFDTLIAQAGLYTLTHNGENIYGCDSTTVLYLTVNPTYNINISTMICSSGSYVFNGQVLTEPGVYTAELSSICGCDSIVTLTLNVGEEYRDTITDHICAGTSYNRYGFDLGVPTETDYYVHTMQSQNNCDSIVVLHLYVHESVTTSLYDTVCEGEWYRRSGFSIHANEPGHHSYTNTKRTTYGCDSLIVLYLEVQPSSNTELAADICANHRFSTYGFDTIFAQPGTYTLIHYGQSDNGCDSNTTLTLNVHPEYHQEINASICYNETYSFDGMELHDSGNYTSIHETAYGCDSITVLHLTVYPEKRDSIEADICLGQSYFENGFEIITPDESGYHSRTVSDAHNCDSTVVLFLNVHQPVIATHEATICLGENYNQYGFDVTPEEAGVFTYTHEGQTEHHCDSIVTLQLTVNPAHHLTQNDMVCAGEPYTKFGFDTTFTQTGLYTLYFEGQNSYGCDSTFTVQLAVYPVFQQEIEAAICHNETYPFNGRQLAETGIYTDTLSTAQGCDSIVTLHLTVYPEKRDSIEAHICEGESYTENGFEIFSPTETGYYSHLTHDSHNCDSTTILHLFVHPHAHTNFVQTLCLGERYHENGFDITATVAGTFTYTQHLQTSFDCDSMVTLQLTVNPTHQLVFNDTVCAGDTYAQHGFDTLFTQGGIYTLTHQGQNSYGCDSTTTLNLCVWPSYRYTISKMICENASYVFNGQTITEAGTYIAELTTIHGCDSIVTLILSIGSEYRDTLTDHICLGESYHQYGFDITLPTETQFYVQQSIASNGCDSTTVLLLNVHDSVVTNIEATLCYGEAYHENGFDITDAEAGTHTYTKRLQTQFGCDSIVRLRLTVNPLNTVTLSDEICAQQPYTQYGFDTVFTQAGSYLLTHHGLNVHGCDSTTTLTLTVYAPDQTELTETACASYTWNDSTYNQSGDYIQHFSNIHNCDSLVTLHLTVFNPDVTEFAETACVSYTWADSTYNQSGDYTRSFTNANGCDSTVTLHLTILPASTSEFSAMACNSYGWNGSTYYQSGNYTQTFTNAHGCDSTVTLHLTILPTNMEEFSATACTSYRWNDSTYYHSGDYVQHFSNAYGCDNIVTLHLTILPASTEEFSASACVSYDWNGSTYYQSGDYTQSFTNVNGCDSIVTLHLTILPISESEFSETSCVSYEWNDSTYYQSGDYTQTFTNENGCDSIVTLHLTILPVIQQVFNEEVCAGESFQQYGFDTLFAEVGTYVLVHEGISADGCDSTVTVHLTVNPTYSADTAVSICDVELPFVWDNNNNYTFWNSGDHNILLQTASGCDSIILLHLNVNPTYNFDTAVTVCNGTLPYYFDEDHSFDHAGTFAIVLETTSGCDSVWNLTLTVTPNTEHAFTQTICANELPYTFMDSVFTEAGQYDIIEADEDNCLTVTHFTLNVNANYHGYDTVTVCEETLPYTYGTTPLTESGDFDIHFSTTASCDSLITVHFTVIPTTLGTDEMFVCTNDFPVAYGDSLFNEEGVYEVTFERDGLCDSIVTLTLHQAQTYLQQMSDEICDNSLPYLWRGQGLTQSGVYYDSLTSIYGCDSVYMLTLTVHETQTIEEAPIMMCDGEVELWHGMILTESGVYSDTLADETTGCHIIYTVTVTVNPTYLFHDTVTVCSNELPYLWRGLSINQPGTREIFLQTGESHCDSIYRLTLRVNPATHTDEVATACDYELPYLWHGQSITESGIYHDTLATALGCDSTFTLTFTVNPSIHEMFADTVCDAALPYLWRGNNITAAGHYTDSIPNSYGCTDVYELHLTVNHGDVTDLSDMVCQGEYYTLNGFDTLAEQAGTLYLHRILTNQNGCDSTVNLTLTVMPSFLTETDAETCDGTPYSWRGNDYIAEGTYYDTLVSSIGCDSVFVLYLTVNPTYDIFVTDTAIRMHEYTYDSFVITPTDSGTYSYDLQYYTLAGCDSIIHLTLYVENNTGIEEYTQMPDFTFFPNPTSALLNIRGEQMRQILVYDLNGKLVRRLDADSPENATVDVTGFSSGHYVVKVLLNNGLSVTRKIVVDRR